MKYAFILHGFNGDTLYTFGPSLKEYLEKKDYKVIAPNFPIRSEATYAGWSKVLDEYKNYFGQNTVVVAHSLGNQFFIKYLKDNNLEAKAYISVAGVCDLFEVEGREDITKAFIDFAVNDKHLNYLKKHVPIRYSLYSDNDHIMPFNLLESFISKIDSRKVFIKGVGHMGNRDNIHRLVQIEDIIDSL